MAVAGVRIERHRLEGCRSNTRGWQGDEVFGEEHIVRGQQGVRNAGCR